MSFGRVCLVTANPLGSSPRLVKEADALHAAGHDVRVVWPGPSGQPGVDRRNEAVLARAAWRSDPAGLPLPTEVVSLTGQLARGLAAMTGSRQSTLAAHAHNPGTAALALRASRESADLFIAHTLGALPAARHAAGRHRARLGFDAEDDEVGELPDTVEERVTREMRAALYAEHLPACDYVTAASPLIGLNLSDRYGVQPVVVHNVFARAERSDVVPHGDPKRPARSRSLYWFSQTVGPDRGLVEVVRALEHVSSDARVVLRGQVSDGYRQYLLSLARQVGADGRVTFLGLESPDHMVALAGEHDLGLSVQVPDTPNHDLSLAHRTFVYLLAGIPQILSDTAAHRALAPRLGAAARLVKIDDALALARAIDSLVEDPAAWQVAAAHSWSLGDGEFNWDREQKILLDLVASVLR